MLANFACGNTHSLVVDEKKFIIISWYKEMGGVEAVLMNPNVRGLNIVSWWILEGKRSAHSMPYAIFLIQSQLASETQFTLAISGKRPLKPSKFQVL